MSEPERRCRNCEYWHYGRSQRLAEATEGECLSILSPAERTAPTDGSECPYFSRDPYPLAGSV